jgi:hypothetical protein
VTDVPAATEDFIRLVDRLEEQQQTDGYLSLDSVVSASGNPADAYIADAVLLIDYRRRADGSPVTLCRLNRRHPLVARLTGW